MCAEQKWSRGKPIRRLIYDDEEDEEDGPEYDPVLLGTNDDKDKSAH